MGKELDKLYEKIDEIPNAGGWMDSYSRSVFLLAGKIMLDKGISIYEVVFILQNCYTATLREHGR